MATGGSTEGLMCYIQDKKESRTVGGNVLFWPEWHGLAVSALSQSREEEEGDVMNYCRRETHDSSPDSKRSVTWQIKKTDQEHSMAKVYQSTENLAAEKTRKDLS